MSDFDTPSTDEVLQGEDSFPTTPVPVELKNVARVDQVPLRIGGTKTISLSDTEPEKVLDANAKRGAVSFIAVGTGVYIAASQAECLHPETSFLIPTNVGVIRFHFLTDVWARKIAVGAPGDVLSILTEDWTR
jgi:hypothetical protein